MFSRLSQNVLLSMALIILSLYLHVNKCIQVEQYISLAIHEQLSTAAPLSMHVEYKIIATMAYGLAILQTALTIANCILKRKNK